jgi:hypothetical protein
MDKVEPKKLFTPPEKCKNCDKIVCRCLLDAYLIKQAEKQTPKIKQ